MAATKKPKPATAKAAQAKPPTTKKPPKAKKPAATAPAKKGRPRRGRTPLRAIPKMPTNIRSVCAQEIVDGLGREDVQRGLMAVGRHLLLPALFLLADGLLRGLQDEAGAERGGIEDVDVRPRSAVTDIPPGDRGHCGDPTCAGCNLRWGKKSPMPPPKKDVN